MKYTQLFIGTCLCIVVFGCNNSSQLPYGVFASPTMKDVGLLKDQHRVEERFVVANNTPDPVHIVNIRSSCGCTKLEISNNVIPSQGTISAKMTVDLKGRYGKRQFESVLSTDCPLAPAIRIAIGGTVAVTTLDGELPFDIGAFPPGSQIDETVSVSKLGNSTAKITAVEQSENSLLKIEPVAENDPDFFKIRVCGHIPEKPGEFRVVAQLSATGTDWKHATIAVRGNSRSRWRYPQTFDLGFIPLGKTLKKEFQITDSFSDVRTSSFVRRVSVTSSGCDSLAVEGTPDRSGAVHIVLSLRNAGVSGPVTCKLKIKLSTADRREHVLEIPVYARCL